ncbi:S-methyl-5-thioribose-1-phosphate isomerase [Patescibacteria group bacterium]|nr:S-methyl-5-thioribose-1-phosphate isomerase [Patescibacteria group bacterium]
MDNSIKQTFKNIKSLKVQGATAVARTTIKALKAYSLKIKAINATNWKKDFKKAADFLLSARPTEPMAQNGVKYIFSQLSKAEPKNVVETKNEAKKAADDFLKMMKNAADLTIKYGRKIIKANDDDILTHCHSWLVEQILIQAKNNKKNFKVYNTETRPLYQGRITSKKLLQAKISTTMVADSSAGFLISHYSGKDLMMDKIILGADALLPDGSVINKIGSFSIGSIAHQEKVPLYIATTLLKFYPKSWIKIERRSPKELWPNAPKNLKIINFAFDRIPMKYITGIICEAGVIKPEAVKKTVKKVYPFL